MLFRSVGSSQIIERLVIDREISHCTSELRRHIGDGGSVGYGKVIQTISETFYKLTDHSMPTKQFSNSQYHICGSSSFRKSSCQCQANHSRSSEMNGLTEHGRVSLDSFHARSYDSQSIALRSVSITLS